MIYEDYIRSGFVEPVISYISSREISAPELETELQTILKSPVVSAQRLCEILDILHELDPVPALGFRLGKMVKPANFGVVGYLVLSSGNAGQALSRYRRFLELLQTGMETWVLEKGNSLHIHWTQRVANTPLAHEYSMAVFINLYQTLIGKPIPPVNIGLPGPAPGDTAVYEAITGCPVHFGSSSLFVELPIRLMSMRVAGSDPYLCQLLEQQAQALLEQMSTVESDFSGFFEKLQEQLVNSMKDGEISAEIISANMGYSLRSFYRKLNESGHSFRSILADIRLRLAKQYLSDLALSHSEIALLLGYSEQSSFIRAFRSWTGYTPGEYREHQIGKKK